MATEQALEYLKSEEEAVEAPEWMQHLKQHLKLKMQEVGVVGELLEALETSISQQMQVEVVVGVVEAE